MPPRPPRACAKCGKRTQGKCKRCYADRDRARGTAHERGYTADWRKARRLYLSDNPLCKGCLGRGKVNGATVVDHIEPHRGDMVLFWMRSNWQPLCKCCHDKKTASGR